MHKLISEFGVHFSIIIFKFTIIIKKCNHRRSRGETSPHLGWTRSPSPMCRPLFYRKLRLSNSRPEHKQLLGVLMHQSRKSKEVLQNRISKVNPGSIVEAIPLLCPSVTILALALGLQMVLVVFEKLCKSQQAHTHTASGMRQAVDRSIPLLQSRRSKESFLSLNVNANLKI